MKLGNILSNVWNIQSFSIAHWEFVKWIVDEYFVDLLEPTIILIAS